jgi:hypothetical protein
VEVLTHPFIKKADETEIDMAAYALGVFEKYGDGTENQK